MSLGTKINLALVAVIAVVLTVAFSIVVNIEEKTIKDQVVGDADVVASLVREDIERTLAQYETQKDNITAVTVQNKILAEVQQITDEVSKFGFYSDFIVYDRNLNVVAVTGGNIYTESQNDAPEYVKYRKDVLSGSLLTGSYERTKNNQDVLTHVLPLYVTTGGNIQIGGLFEVDIIKAVYLEKVNALRLRMIGIGIMVTAILVLALALILRREVVAPIKRYSRVAQKISDGDLSQIIDSLSDDEIGSFGAVFNSMVINLRELDQMKADFVSVMVHQLRAPLTGMKWVLKLILDGEIGVMTDEQKDVVKQGYETNEKMIELVNDLLNVSRIENQKLGYRFEKNDFIKVLDAVVLNTELARKDRNINLHIENHTRDLEPFFFDEEKLSMAFQNLIDNAIKYTLPGGKVTIGITKEGDNLKVKISDTGLGIPASDVPKLFTKFFRASNVVHLEMEGSGLGLFIVKNIILGHSGKISVESVEGKGTSFTVVIPLVNSKQVTEEHQSSGEVTSKSS